MKKSLILTPFLFCIVTSMAQNQQLTLTLTQAIETAQRNSLPSMVARLNYMSSYWNYRSFKAELLPSVNLSGSVMQYNHSTVEARNYDTGEIRMVDNNSLTNSVTLSVDQNIAALGGALSLQTYLYRLDQFNYDTKTYNSQPLRVSYKQPLFAYNALKWKQKTEPAKFSKAKRTYLEAQEAITVTVVNRFFAVLAAQSAYEQSKTNLADRERLFSMSKKRLSIGTITKADHLQLELSLLNAKVNVKEKELALSSANFALGNYLMLAPFTELELVTPGNVPAITLNNNEVLQKALENSTFLEGQKLEEMAAEQTLAQAQSARGLQMTLNADVGFNRTANHLRDAYRSLENEQIVGVTFSMPVFDWGVSKGRVRMAKADLEATIASHQQAYEQYVESLSTEVMEFNIQHEQCGVALRAQEIADERYEITRRRFEAGGITVTDLNTAWSEAESARASYISRLHTFWTDYYTLRKATLYDWLKNKPLTVDYDALISK